MFRSRIFQESIGSVRSAVVLTDGFRMASGVAIPALCGLLAASAGVDLVRRWNASWVVLHFRRSQCARLPPSSGRTSRRRDCA